MPKGQTLRVVFKQDFQSQGVQISWMLEELVPADHPIRTISAVVDTLSRSSKNKACILLNYNDL